MPYFKKPGVQVLGRPRGIGAEIVVEGSASIAACAVANVTLRGSGGGGGGCVYGGPNGEYADGQRGLGGGLIANAVRRITAALANYVRGNRGSGGGRTAISGPTGEANDGGNSQASTFLDITVSGVNGGQGAWWFGTIADGGTPRAPSAVTNPDGSEAGRGGFGGNGAQAQPGLAGQYGKLFLKILGF